MADRLRLVVRNGYGKTPVTHLDFSDGTYVNPVRDSFQFTAPEHAPITASPQGRWGGQRTVTESHNNGTVAVRLLVREPNGTADDALARVSKLLQHADHFSQYGTRTMIEWRPDGAATSTYFELRGSPTWEPSYRWITFQSSGHSVELGLTFPVAPLAEGGELDIYDDFAPRGDVLYQNMCENPGFELDASGWSAQTSAGITSTFVRSTAWASEGVASGRHQVTANTGGTLTVDSQWVKTGTTGIPAVPNETWTVTAVINVTVNSSTGAYARLTWKSSTGATISSSTGTKVTGTGVKTVTCTAQAPSTTAFVSPRIGITTASTELIDYSIDKVTIAKTSDTAMPPFTGDTEAAAWTGTEQQSTSCLYNDSSRNDYRQDVGASTAFAISNGSFRPLTGAGGVALVQTQRGYEVPDAQGTIEYLTGSVVTNIFHAVRLKVRGSNTYISCQLQGGSLIRIYRVQGGGSNQLNSAGITTLVPGQRYWLRGRIEGNVITVEHWTTDPTNPANAPANTLSATLSATDQAAFGADVPGMGGFMFDPDDTSDLSDRLYSYRYEPYTYANKTLPDEFDLQQVPGDAPAAVDVVVEKPSNLVQPYFGMFGWGPEPEGENFIVNGDFESLGSNGWVDGPGNPAVAGATGTTITAQFATAKYGTTVLQGVTAGVAADEAMSFKMYRRFRKGVTYTLDLWYKQTAGVAATPRIALGSSTTDRSLVSAPAAGSSVWQRATTTWTPTADRENASAVFTGGSTIGAYTFQVDAVQVYEGVTPTAPTQTEGRGAQAPFGVIEAEAASWPNNTSWAVTTDANARGGNVTSGTMSGTVSHGWWIDPMLASPDEFLEDVQIEFWANGTFASTAVTPAAILSARSEVTPISGTGPSIYTSEYGTQGKQVPFSGAGATPFLTRLGTLTFPASLAGTRWYLKLDLVFGAGSSGTGKLDYIFAVPVNRRFASPSGKSSSLTSYHPFFATSGYVGAAERKRITYDLAGRSIANTIGNREQASAGVGGALIEPSPGDVRFVGLISGQGVPDDPAGVSDQVPAAKVVNAVHFAITPRYRFVRSA